MTLRSDESRIIRWKDLLSRVRDALVALGPEHLAGLRPRKIAAATR